MNRAETVWLWLSRTQGLSAGRARELVDFFGGEEVVWEAGHDELSQALGSVLASRLCAERNEAALLQHVQDCLKLGQKILTPAHPLYPAPLRDLYDPPCALYARGNLELLGTDCLTIVGTRRHTPYGRRITERLAGELARAGLTIVSGLAQGLDGVAHRAALEAGGRTIAVLGNGLDISYPALNAALQEEIAQKGLLLSEYPPGTRPSRGSFPVRNRILAALSLGTLVTEAGEKSGTLLTAEVAMDLGRELFTVPGNIDSPASYATNRLLRTSAEMVLEAVDVLRVLGMEPHQPAVDEACAHVELDAGEQVVLRHLQEGPRSFDELAVLTQFSAAKLNSLLTMLQLKGIIDQTAGRVFTTKS